MSGPTSQITNAARLLLLDFGYTPLVLRRLGRQIVAAYCLSSNGVPIPVIVVSTPGRGFLILSEPKYIVKQLNKSKQKLWEQFKKEQSSKLGMLLARLSQGDHGALIE
jgi:hypothetical protein